MKLALHWQILIAMALGLVFALSFGEGGGGSTAREDAFDDTSGPRS